MRTGWHITATSGWWAAVALALGWLISGVRAGYAADPPEATNVVTTNFPTLTNAVQVLNLPAQRARTALPVCILGIVTSYSNGVMLFVQDETAGIYVYYTGERLPLRPGAAVRVSGVTGQGRYSPIVIPSAIEPVREGPALSPRPVSLAEIYYGGLDEQWVEATGTICWHRSNNQPLEVQLLDPPYRSSVWIVEGATDQQVPPAGSKVRVRGVVGASVTDRGEVGQFRIIANTAADIAVLCPAPADPFALPLVPLAEVSAPHVRSRLPGLIRVQGVVTLFRPPRQLFLQDASGGVEVRSDGLPAMMRAGTAVDIVGLLPPLTEPARMEAVYLRTNNAQNVVHPRQGVALQLNPDRYDSQLVEIDCTLLSLTYSGSNGLAVGLGFGEKLISAFLDPSPPRSALAGLEPGCLVRATGIWRSETKADSGLAGVLLLRGPGDLLFLRSPLATPTPSVVVLRVVCAIALLGVAAALWFWWQQWCRTQRCCDTQAVLQAEMRHSEGQLRRAMEERERIARDLHDEIIQSIYAVGLTLEDCRRNGQRVPEQNERRLGAAVDTLNSTIRSIRGFIAGLEPKILNGREFKTALKSLALISGDDPAQFQIEVDAAAANGLTAVQATHLLHIAKEAMSNSLRHAHASKITVSLHPLGMGVRMEVCDDGQGLPTEAGGAKGHGLRNMSARVREIGGALEIVSAPGQGCRILVTVPQRDLHEPE